MPTITAGSARVHYTATGTGPALVLVHGTGAAGAQLTWGRTAPGFADRHTVLLPDLSGTERTTDDGAPLTVETLAGQVVAVLEDAADGPADLLGFSLGAPVVTAVAATRPDLVRRLITLAGWAHTDSDAYLRNLFALWARLGRLDADAFGRSVTLTGFSRRFLNAIGPAETEELIAAMAPTPGALRHVDLDRRLDIRPLLPRVTAPTLVIGCTHDATVPVEHSRALRAALPGAEYAEIDAGHGAFLERPAEFTKLVRDFIA